MPMYNLNGNLNRFNCVTMCRDFNFKKFFLDEKKVNLNINAIQEWSKNLQEFSSIIIAKRRIILKDF